jgi:hypothetical protein
LILIKKLFVVSSKFFLTEKEKLEQIERDKLLSLRLFDEINMRNPANNQSTAFPLAEKGGCGVSLKQIMVEQMCEEYQRDRSKKPTLTQVIADGQPPAEVCNFVSPHDSLFNKQSKSENSLANMIKLKQMQEKYEKVVDSKMIEEVLENKKYPRLII